MHAHKTALVGGVTSLAASSLETVVSGGTVDEILASMRSQLDKVVQGVNGAADAVSQAVDDDLDQMLGGGPDGFSANLVGKQPAVDAYGFGGFTYPDGLTD